MLIYLFIYQNIYASYNKMQCQRIAKYFMNKKG